MLLAEASGTFSCRPGVGEFCLVCKSRATQAVARLGPGEVVGETGGVALLASQTCAQKHYWCLDVPFLLIRHWALRTAGVLRHPAG